MSDKETAPTPDYNAAMAWLDKQFPYPAGPRAMTWAEIIACLALYKAEPVAVECRAPAPQPEEFWATWAKANPKDDQQRNMAPWLQAGMQ